MKIAILSDIHGNHIALDRVLDSMSNVKIDYYFILGDLVGYYYHPDKVLASLNKLKNVFYIKGNHEYMLEAAMKSNDAAEEIRKKYGLGIDYAIKKLTSNEINFLTNLPDILELSLAEKTFLLAHGSPWKNDQYIYEDSEESLFLKLDTYNKDYILLGHTHRFFHKKLSNTTVINSGSIGQSRIKGGIANYCILDITTGQIDHMSVDFDITQIIKEVSDDCPYLSKILKK